jgi:hypothetical protein
MAGTGALLILLSRSPHPHPTHQVYDLLDLTNDVLAVKWDAKAKTFVVTDLLPVECPSFDDIITVVAEGYRNRRIGSTALNKESSRSHRCVVVCGCVCLCVLV